MANLINLTLTLRIFSALLALIELGINAYVVYYADDYNYEDPYGDWGVHHHTPSQVAFLLFASTWSLLALVYLTLAPIYFITGGQQTSHVGRNAKHRYTILALDVVTTVFWLAGWIALAKLIGGPSTCITFCAAIQASVAFAAFLWATFGICGLVEMWQLWRRGQSSEQKANRTEDVDRTWFGMS